MAGTTRREWLLAGAGFAALPLAACGAGGGDPGDPPPGKRTWRMGFSPNPPRLTVQAVLQGIDLWSRRAELAIIHEELPWAELLAGTSAQAIVDRDKVPLVNYLRGKGLQLVFMGDLNDGLDRAREAP